MVWATEPREELWVACARRRRRPSASRRGGGRDAAGSASTGRGRARSSGRTWRMTSHTERALDRRRSRAHRRRARGSSPSSTPSSWAAARASCWRRTISASRSSDSSPAALRAVGEDEEVDLACRPPPTSRASHRTRTRCRRDGRRSRARSSAPRRPGDSSARRDAVHAQSQVAVRAARSAGRSTSKPSNGSRRTRTASPAPCAAATWRRNDPGPYARENDGPDRDGDHGRAVVAVARHDRRRSAGRRPRRIATSPPTGRAGEVGVRHDRPDQTVARAPGDRPLRRARFRSPGSSSTVRRWRTPHARTSSADDTMTAGRRRGRGDHLVGHPLRELRAGRVLEGAGEAGLAHRERPDRDHDSRSARVGTGREP